MKAARILDLDEATFIEPSFSDLTEDIFTHEAAALPATDGKLLVDENENLLAIAFYDGNRWQIATFLFRNPRLDILEKFEALNGDIYQEDREVWLSAVREYYSLRIQKEVTPALEDLPLYRRDLIREIAEEIWGRGDGIPCLDCCCGSGVGSDVLRSLSMQPLSYDSDPSLISLGLSSGRLHPEETMCIDGTCASRYITPLQRGVGFMLGAIDAFNQDIWEGIVMELLALTDETLITVGTEKEAQLIEGWCQRKDRKVKRSLNDRDPIYDRWVVLAEK